MAMITPHDQAELFAEEGTKYGVLEATIPLEPWELYSLLKETGLDSTKSRQDFKDQDITSPSQENPYTTALPTPTVSRASTTSRPRRSLSVEGLPTLGLPTPSPSLNQKADTNSNPSICRQSTENHEEELISSDSFSRHPSSLSTTTASLNPQKSIITKAVTTSVAIPASESTHGIVQLDRKHYVSPTMVIPSEYVVIWDSGIRERLKDALCRSARATHDTDAPLALEFYMAGPSPKKLRPSIIITCCSGKKKREIKGLLGGLRWMKDCGLRCIVTIDKTFGSRAGLSAAIELVPKLGARLPDVPQTVCGVQAQITTSHIHLVPKLEARLPDVPQTVCGVQAQITTSHLDTPDTVIKFTLGGVICVNESLYCLTSAHPFKTKEPELHIEENNSECSDSEEYESDSSGHNDTEFGSLDELSRADSANFGGSTSRSFDMSDQTDQTDVEVPFRIMEENLLLSLERKVSSMDNNSTNNSLARSDWALFRTTAALEISNVIHVPGDKAPTTISGIVLNEELYQGYVWVAAGSGLQRGVLSAYSVSISLHGSSYEVRQITLGRSLAHGDSGSWVIRDGYLCGYIIAGRDSLPWAYMIQIEDVFTDIRSYFGREARVFIPSEVEICRMRHVLANLTPIVILHDDSEAGSKESLGVQSIKSSLRTGRSSFIVEGTTSPSITSQNLKSVTKRQDDNEDEDEDEKAGVEQLPTKITYPGSLKLIAIALIAIISVLMLDIDYIATAIPKITDHFSSLDDVGWYTSSYIFSKALFHLFYGNIYSKYSIKYTFITAIGISAIGPLICGLASTSAAFIIGRVITGAGSAGVFPGANYVLIYCVPLARRPITTGTLGLASGIATIINPIITGAFTDLATWRWVFFSKILVAVPLIFSIILLVEPPKGRPHYPQTVAGITNFVNIWIPLVVLVVSIILWVPINLVGRQLHGARSGSVLGASIGVVIVLLIITLLTIYSRSRNPGNKDNSFLSMMRLRSMSSGMIFGTLTNSSFSVLIFYLPIWFQTIKAASAIHSSIMNLGTMLAIVVSFYLGSSVIETSGVYAPLMIVSTIIASVGAGLICTFTGTTSSSAWIGFQVIFGIGIGIGMRTSYVAAQTVLPLRDISFGVNIITFSQFLGSAVFTSVAHSIFMNTLIHHLPVGTDPKLPLRTGITSIFNDIPSDQAATLLDAYNGALVNVFYLAAALAASSIFGSLTVEWLNTKKKKEDIPEQPQPRAEVGEQGA